MRAGLGLVGDRYFGARAHRDAAVTFVSAGAVADLPGPPDLVTLRHNVLVRGLDVDALVGSVLTLDSGDGGVRTTPWDDGILRVGPVQTRVDPFPVGVTDAA